MKLFDSKKKKLLWFIFAIFLVCFFLSVNAGSKVKNPVFGVTFSPDQAEALGLNWKDLYVKMLDDLGVKNLRISAYWNQVQPQNSTEYNFEKLDFQVLEAEKRGVKLVLALGKKLPRWPECHTPNWVRELSESSAQNAQLAYMETVVKRYMFSSAVIMWQVENEPYLDFGECPVLNKEFFDKEIALVKSIDPSRKILITDSGELSSWLQAGTRGDVFGTTLYRYVFSDVFKRYWVNYIPFWFYRIKGGLLRVVEPGKQIIIIELQTEPWTTKGITSTPIEEQFKTMSIQKFEKMLSVAKATGYSPQYLWGVEWWEWMNNQGHPEYWERAKEIFD